MKRFLIYCLLILALSVAGQQVFAQGKNNDFEISRNLDARHRDALDEALSMIQESMATVLDDPAGAVQLAAFEEVGLPAQTVLSAMPRLNGDYQSSAESGEAIRRYLTVLHDFDPRTTGGSVPDEGFFYR